MDFLEGGGGGSLEHAVVDGFSASAVFVGSGLVGNEIEKMVKKDVTATSPWTDKLIAAGVNNLPKGIVYYLLDMLGSGREIDAGKLGAVANIIIDLGVRASNNGVNTGKLFGFNILANHANKTGAMHADVQRLIQENSAIRGELNKALQRLAALPMGGATGQLTAGGAAPIVYVQPVQQVANPLQVPNRVQSAPMVQQPVVRAQQPIIHERERKFGFMGEDEDRRRRFSSMPTYDAPVPVKGRERKFGFMKEGAEQQNVAAMFGML